MRSERVHKAAQVKKRAMEMKRFYHSLRFKVTAGVLLPLLTILSILAFVRLCLATSSSIERPTQQRAGLQSRAFRGCSFRVMLQRPCILAF